MEPGWSQLVSVSAWSPLLPVTPSVQVWGGPRVVGGSAWGVGVPSTSHGRPEDAAVYQFCRLTNKLILLKNQGVLFTLNLENTETRTNLHKPTKLPKPHPMLGVDRPQLPL